MGCPKCQCEEISPSGMCLWCGYQVNEPAEESEPTSIEHPSISTIPAKTAAEELPEWRKQLSQRLSSIKQKHEAPSSIQGESQMPLPEDSTIPELEKTSEPRQSATGVKPADLRKTEGLLDDRTSGQSRQMEAPFKTATGNILSPAGSDFYEGLMILMSRTLSGLVDLIIIGLVTGALLVAADVFSGVQVLGFRSIVNYSVLFLLIYFMYSLFFFRASSQTIGMMMTNLRLVTDMSTEPPRLGRILIRCFGYLISLLCLGIGLLWALFDPEHRCFHDRLTNTRVVRI